MNEEQYLENYKALWASSPFPPVFVTVDAVVISEGRVLLVKRKGHPGMGKWALPGGFINPDETLLAAVYRELEEETGLDIGDLSMEKVEVFDNPYRSKRGRTITHAFYFYLERCAPVKAGDDAGEVRWVYLSELEDLYEDHQEIIEYAHTKRGLIQDQPLPTVPSRH